MFSLTYDIHSVPWYTVVTIGIENSETCLLPFPSRAFFCLRPGSGPEGLSCADFLFST